LLELTSAALTHPHDAPIDCAQHAALLDGRLERYQREKRYRHKDGRTVWARLTVSPLRSDEAPVAHLVEMVEDITEQKLAQEDLRAVESRYRDLFENAGDMIFTLDTTGRLLAINRTVERFTGWRREEMLGQPVARWIAPESGPWLAERLALLRDWPAEEEIFPFEVELVRRDGTLLCVEINAHIVYENQCPLAVEGIMRDITARKRAEAALRASEERLRAVVTNAPIALFSCDLRGVLTLADGRGVTLLDAVPGDLIGRAIADVFGATPALVDQLRRALHGETVKLIVQLAGRAFEASCAPLRDDRGVIAGAIGVATDITERAASETRLKHQASHDPLTDLPNRSLFGDRLEAALVDPARHSEMLAALFLDLDRFKVINDSLGHDIGDRLLVAVANRLGQCVRPGDTVARLGGDEFTILLNGISGEREAARVAERITEMLQRPFQIEGHEVLITASIGIVIAEPGSRQDTAADLIRYADMAMYQAKGAGKARYAVFDRSMGAPALARLALEADLRHALGRGEFLLEYQPQIDLARGEVAGVEALLRWHHGARGSIDPSEFIPLAEETGLILPLGRWALDAACREARRWQDWQAQHRAGATPLSVSVNLSARQFQDPELAADVGRILAETGLPATSLRLEIAETVLMREAAATRGTLEALLRLGVRLSIDGFGTGHSSLGNLKRFPVDMLKIDRTFIAGLGRDREDEAIVGAVVTLGRALGLQLCAEGVETATQVAYLQRLGCDLAQGYHFSAPLPVAALDAWLAAYSAPQGAAPKDCEQVTTGRLLLPLA